MLAREHAHRGWRFQETLRVPSGDAEGGIRERRAAVVIPLSRSPHTRTASPQNRTMKRIEPASGTHDGQVGEERLRAELLLRGRHELVGHLLRERGRVRGDADSVFDAARGERAGHGALVHGKGKRHRDDARDCGDPGMCGT